MTFDNLCCLGLIQKDKTLTFFCQVLRPISRLGGITYGRTTEAFELPRPDFDKDVGGEEGYDKLKANGSGNKK